MNWLAHVYLSPDCVQYQLGNLLADPLKGRAWAGASQRFIDGMHMHKAIDRFTDSHPLVSLSKSRLKKRGPLKGVVVDVLYDHFLSTHWHEYSGVGLSCFLASFYQHATRVAEDFPEQAKRIVHGIAQSNLLAEYTDFEGVATAFERINCRLSPRVQSKDAMGSYLKPIASHYSDLERDFEGFFPDLLAFFQQRASAEDYN